MHDASVWASDARKTLDPPLVFPVDRHRPTGLTPAGPSEIDYRPEWEVIKSFFKRRAITGELECGIE
jgi:hypothetical protein